MPTMVCSLVVLASFLDLAGAQDAADALEFFTKKSGGICLPFATDGSDSTAFAEDCFMGTSCKEIGNFSNCGFPTDEECVRSCLSRYGANLRCAEFQGPEHCCCQYTHPVKAPAYPENFCWHPTGDTVTYVLKGSETPSECPNLCGTEDERTSFTHLPDCHQPAISQPPVVETPFIDPADFAISKDFQLMVGGWCMPQTVGTEDYVFHAEDCRIGTMCNGLGGCGFPTVQQCFGSCLQRYGSALRCVQFYQESLEDGGKGPEWCCCHHIHPVKAPTYPHNFCWFEDGQDSTTYVYNGTRPQSCDDKHYDPETGWMVDPGDTLWDPSLSTSTTVEAEENFVSFASRLHYRGMMTRSLFTVAAASVWMVAP